MRKLTFAAAAALILMLTGTVRAALDTKNFDLTD